jgi:eukaryotic-like serine/threonine-protein kinase
MPPRDSHDRPPPRDAHRTRARFIVSGALRLANGRVFAGDFKVLRPLRAGGQGSLYVVEQLSTGRQRALKLMLPELVAQPASRKRFELEAKIAARIRSDHVVESIASGVDAESGTPWLVMELLEGEDLAHYIKRKKCLGASEVLEIFSQLCHAVGEAHRQGIVHRDLKPENVFLATPRRRGVPFMVKVLDFGIARIIAESTVSSATTSSIGTPMWMAPEQTIPGGPIAPSSDVWPLGLIAFRLLTGHLFWKAPYDASASVLMLMAEAFMHPVPLASERAEHYKCKDRLPPGFDAWFAKCVARKMEDRYPDAAEAFGALEPLLVPLREETPEPSKRSGSARLPEGFDPATLDPYGPDSVPFVGPRAEIAPRAAGAQEVTGPGRKTWDGAPELAAEAVLSAVPSDPAPAPISSDGAQPDAAASDASATDEPVQTATPVSSGFGRRRALMVVAATLGAALVLGVVALVSSSSAPRSARAVPAATASKAASAEAPSAGENDPSAEASASATAEPAPVEPATNVVRRGPKLCKPTGGKCLGNDDCCDRVCRHWTCRTNAAMRDPYGDGK